MITYLSRSLEWLDFTDTGLLKSLFLAPPTTPKRGKRLLCRLGAVAPRRHNRLFPLGRGLPLLSATFEKPWRVTESALIVFSKYHRLAVYNLTSIKVKNLTSHVRRVA